MRALLARIVESERKHRNRAIGPTAPSQRKEIPFEDAAGNFATPLTLGYDYPGWATNQWSDYIHLGKYAPNPHPANSSWRDGIAGCTNFKRSTIWTCPRTPVRWL